MLRNVSVGAGRRKSKGAKERIAAEKAAAGASRDNDGENVGTKRSRAGSGDPDANEARGKATRTSKRDGSSDGSATEAEQGEGTSGYARGTGPWNGSNAASDTAFAVDRLQKSKGAQRARNSLLEPMYPSAAGALTHQSPDT